MTDSARSILLHHGGAVLFTALALALRWLLDPWLDDHLPFVTFFVAVALAAWLGGLRPALLATLLGFAAALYFFVPPRFLLVLPTGPHLFGLAMYFMVSLAFAALGEALHVARRRAEAGREVLLVTLASIGDAVIATDAEGRVTFLNDMARDLTGWAQEEASGRPLTDVFRIVNEQNRKPIESPVERVLKSGRVVGMANRTVLLRKDGTERPIDDNAAPIRGGGGGVLGVVLVFRDVTEKRRAEEARRSLAAIVESSDDAIIGKDLEGTITSWNGGAERLYGYAAAEILGSPFTILVPFDRAAEAPDNARRLQRGERLDHFETVRRRKDGTLIDVSVSYSPINDGEGNLVGTAVITRDISERKRSEEQLRRSERELADFFDNASVGSHWVGPDGIILRANRAELDLLGYEREEYVGRHIAEFHADPPVVEDMLLRLQAGERLTNYPARIRCKDGSLKDVLIDSSVLWQDGRFVHSRCFTRDVTEQKRAEAAARAWERHLQLVTDNAPVFLTHCDAQRRFKFVNKPYAARFGLQPRDIVGRTIPDVLGEEAFAVLAPHVQVALGGRRVEFEAEVPYRDLGPRHMRCAYEPEFDETGDVVGYVGAVLDVTEGKKVERALREAEARFAAVVNHAPACVFAKDRQGRYLLANRSLARLVGREPGDFPGRTDYDFFPPEVAAQFAQDDAAIIEAGQPRTYEESFPHEGVTRTYLTVKFPLRDEKGDAYAACAVATEITDLKRAQDALRSTAERLNLALAAARLGDWSWDAAIDVVTFSERAAEIFGIPPGPHMTWTAMQALLHEEDRDRARREVEEAVVRGTEYDIEYRVNRPDGRQVWVAALGRAHYSPAGQALGMFGVVQDITARKEAGAALRESEERFRAAVDQAAVGVALVGPGNRTLFTNRGLCEMLGYTEAELLAGSFIDVTHPGDVQIDFEHMPRLLSGEANTCRYEKRYRHKNGSVVWGDVSVSAVRDGRGEVKYVVGVVVDITERKRAHEALRESEERLRLALEAGRMGVWDWHVKTNAIRWSDNLEPIHGLAPGTFGGTVEAFQQLIHPEDREAVNGAIARALEDRSSYDAEFRIVWPDGSVHWMAGKGKVFTDDGQPARMVGVGMDVTEKKWAEGRLREETRLAETLNRVGLSLAAELDLQRIVQTVTDEATSLTGARFGAFFYKVLDGRGEAYTLFTVSGVPRTAFEKFPMPRNTAVFDPTFKGRGVVRLDDVTKDPRYGQNAPYHGMPEGHLPVSSYLAVPVVSRSGEVLGGLFFGHPEPGVFTERHERAVAGIAAQASVAIDNARLYGQVQESEQRFRQLAEHVEDVFYVSDARHPQVLYVSPAYEQVWGRSRQSLYEQPRSFLEAVHPDDRPRVGASLERQVRGEATTEEYRITRPDGTLLWIWDRAFPIRDAGGQVVRVAGIAEDITERKRGEDVLRFLADASASLSSVVDYRSTLRKVARLAVPAFADWSAVDIVEADGLLRRLAVAHTDPAKVKLAEELYQRYPPDPDRPHGAYHVLRTGESEMMGQIPDSVLVESARDEEHLRILRELGLRSFMCVPLRGRGNVLGVFTFVSAESGRRYAAADITFAEELARRAAVAIENAQLYEALREADRRKDEFLATLAHELRNPLAPIRNSLQILKMPVADRTVIERSREMMERQVQHLVRLVDDLLDVSRVMRGKVELRRERVDLAAVVARAVETAQPAIDAHGHELTITPPPEPVELDADPVRLAQVVGNLLTNAAKYTRRDGRIWVSAAREGGKAVLRVRDDGIGITPDMLPKIFGLFVQVEDAVSRSQGGLGIGLTLAKSLVEMHGGTIEAHSAGLGQGSEFVVRLPRAPEMVSAGGGQPEGNQPQQTAAALKRRVLVVDDNVDAAESLAMLLRLQGHEVSVAHDGRAALRVAQEARPDLVVLDIGMPGMDGYEVARRLRADPGTRDLQLVALTGWGQEQDRRRTKEAGFDHHLVKPADPEGIQELIRRLDHGPG